MACSFGTKIMTHEFSLYLKDLSTARAGQSLTITDSDLIHRMMFVLRLKVDDTIILFDQTTHAEVILEEMVKHKMVRARVHTLSKNKIFTPRLTILLPLLKKESLETALYALTEVGANSIVPIITHKSAHSWTPKEYERAQKIIIAAAEQSKNFAFPSLMQPVKFAQAISSSTTAATKIFFDPQGNTLTTFLSSTVQSAEFIIAVGPEGDLTPDEKELLKNADFTFVALTPTVLRACQAVALGVGMIRSLIK